MRFSSNCLSANLMVGSACKGMFLARRFRYMPAMMGFSAANVTPEGQRGVWMTYTLLSALGGIAAIPLLLKCYTLTDKKVAIMMKANNGEISKQEALKQIGE